MRLDPPQSIPFNHLSIYFKQTKKVTVSLQVNQQLTKKDKSDAKERGKKTTERKSKFSHRSEFSSKKIIDTNMLSAESYGVSKNAPFLMKQEISSRHRLLQRRGSPIQSTAQTGPQRPGPAFSGVSSPSPSPEQGTAPPNVIPKGRNAGKPSSRLKNGPLFTFGKFFFG